MIIGSILIIIAAVLTGSVLADAAYNFELKEVYSFSEKEENWSVKISVPRISGMADEKAQDQLNAHFLAEKDSVKEGYEQDAEYARKSLAEGNQPHFSYEYYWDIITDSDDYFVFRTSSFVAGASSFTGNEYWNLDKKTGQLLDFEKDAVTTPEQMSAIRDKIYADMKASIDSGEGMYWIEDDTFDKQLAKVGELNHWYYNADGDLVITFDKYEIAPGAMGEQQFVIPAAEQ